MYRIHAVLPVFSFGEDVHVTSSIREGKHRTVPIGMVGIRRYTIPYCQVCCSCIDQSALVDDPSFRNWGCSRPPAPGLRHGKPWSVCSKGLDYWSCETEDLCSSDIDQCAGTCTPEEQSTSSHSIEGPIIILRPRFYFNIYNQNSLFRLTYYWNTTKNRSIVCKGTK
jgi:hypothetical protein